MTDRNSCPHCGAELPADAPRGLCPQCLIKTGLEDDIDRMLENHPIIEGSGAKIGNYELLELIGEGGMGLVYLAEQKEPVKRKVALKIVKLGMDTKQVVTRFEAERQTLAVLEHPNIAHVFDAGTTETGRPYFVMEYVEGKSVTKYCDEHKLSVEERLELFRQVCEGVHHAHQKGIIHRDIKPSNILVSVQDDKAVPKIIDFGIAKAITQPLTEKTSYTEQGQLLGTPEYMSPEQAEMSYQDVDTRSDIYSLGVVLYELLAGVTPFDAKRLREGGIDHIQQVICEEQPKTPSAQLTSLGDRAKTVAESRRTQIMTLTRRLHRELEWIPMKAMRKERTRRYRSASELADDIQNYLTGTPLIAGPESTVYRARKFVRKHAGSVATVALVAVLIVLGLVVSTALSFRAEKAREKEAVARTRAEQAQTAAQEQRRVAEERADNYRRLLYVHSVALADVKYRERNIFSARKLLESCPEDLRNWEWYRLNYVLDESLMTFGPGFGYCSIALSPDGKRIASGTGNGTITIWDAASGTEIMTLNGQNKGWVMSVAFSPDGKRIVSGGSDRTVKVWDASTGDEVMTLEGHEGSVSSVVFTPDGKRIVSGSFDKTVKVWDASSGEELITIQGGWKRWIHSVRVSTDGKRIIAVAGKSPSKITEWDAATGEELRTFRIPDRTVNIAKYSPDGRRIALGCGEGMIKILNAATGEEIIDTVDSGRHRGGIGHIAFSPDGKRIASGSGDNTVKVWDAATGNELTTLVGHERSISDVAFSPDGKRIVSADWSGKIKIWDADKESTTLEGHGSWVRGVLFSIDGKQLISASEDKTIKVWDVSEANAISTLRGHEDWVMCVAHSPDGKRLVSGSLDKTIRIWDAESGEELRKISTHDSVVMSVAFSPDGKQIASGDWDKTVKLWDASTGEELRTLSGHTDWVLSVVFSPDGKRIISGSSDKTIKVWDAASGEEIMTLSGHERKVGPVSFSPDGRKIVSGSEDNTIKVWDSATGDELMTLHGHNGIILAVAISPDGKRIVSASNDSTTKVWDAATGAELMTLPAEEHGVSGGIAFSPDGKTIADACGGDIVLWESGPRPAVGGSDQGGESTQKVVD